MKQIFAFVLVLLSATFGAFAQTSACHKVTKQYAYENPQADLGGVSGDMVNGECVIRTGAAKLGNPTQSQVNALAAAYDTRMATKQAAANALYSTISTRLGLATPITTKAQLQSRITEVWDAMDDKEQQVWTAIEASGLNATRAGQLKQLAQARNKILRLLAEDGIQ